jgi:hypothetical protein
LKDGHLEALSAESQSLAVLANNRLTVATPAAVAGYDGWCVMVGTGSTTVFLQDGTGGPTFPIPFGTDYQEPNAHFSTVPSQYTAAWLGSAIYADLNASTTYYFYPFYDVASGVVRFAPFNIAVGDTAPSMADASQAWLDGRISLSGASMAVAVGGAGGSGSPTAGGSRLT